MKTSRIAAVLFILNLTLSLYPQERFRRNPPLPDPIPSMDLPEIQTTELSNGLNLSVIRKFHLPTVTLILTVQCGESCSPDLRPGLATFTSQMLELGSLNLSSDEISESIDSIGGTFVINTYLDYTQYMMTFLEENLDQALQLLSEMILKPSFSRQEVDSLKRTLFYVQARQSNDPSFIGRRLLFRILFKDHSYEKYVFTEDVLGNIDRKDIQEFYATYYLPNNAHMTLIGNLSLSNASRNVSKHFNTWRKVQMEYRAIPSPSPSDKIRICFVDIPRSKDAFIYMGNLLPPKNDPDYFPLLVLNQVLGGSQISRLFMNLRESKEYAYLASSSLDFFRACGILVVRAQVRPEVIVESINEILGEFRNITSHSIPAIEIEDAKANLIGNFPLSIESQENMAALVSENYALNLGNEHWNRFNANVANVTPSQVAEVSGRLPWASSVIVIAGDKDNVIEYIKRFAEVEIYDLKGQFQYKIVKE